MKTPVSMKIEFGLLLACSLLVLVDFLASCEQNEPLPEAVPIGAS